jgi:hypothetical protein
MQVEMMLIILTNILEGLVPMFLLILICEQEQEYHDQQLRN